jgi:hypothetical protein
MSLILMATVLSGLCFAKLLWWSGLRGMAWRFPLVLLLSYGCFFVLIRLWLIYLTRPYQRPGGVANSRGGGFNLAVGYSGGGSSGGGSSASGESLFKGGGSGGGGASGSFADGDSPAPAAALLGGSSSAGDEAGKAAGGVLSGLGDSDGWILVVLGVLVLAILGSSIFVIYEAPAILSEAAFQFLLAGGILRQARQARAADWMGSVFSHTCKPFALAMLLAAGAGIILGRLCPQASKLSEVFRICL